MMIVRWGVYKVDDALVRFPDTGHRVPKKTRFFIVTAATVVCSDRRWSYVLGIPTSTKLANQYDVELPASTCGTSQISWARVAALQPFAKHHLTNRVGMVEGPTRIQIAESLLLLTVDPGD